MPAKNREKTTYKGVYFYLTETGEKTYFIRYSVGARAKVTHLRA